MRYALSLENIACVRSVVVQDLKELGIRFDAQKREQDQPPTIKKSRSREDSLNVECCGSSVFGNCLDLVPSVAVDGCGTVPKFLADAIELLENSLDVEGLFRKSGSINRLKELRMRVEAGEVLDDAQPLDVAVLLKQFLRELPNPLLTSALYDIFVQCVDSSAVSPDGRVSALDGRVSASDCRISVSDKNISLLDGHVPAPTRSLSVSDGSVRASDSVLRACLLLPSTHLATLRHVALFLSRVAAASDRNRMDAANLAVCLAPNLLHCGDHSVRSSGAADGSVLGAETAVVRLLIERADEIGMVTDELLERATLLNSCYYASDVDDQNGIYITNSASKSKNKKKKKKRSGSLQGLVTSLSASFSRWRSNRSDKSSHNSSTISDRSTMSFVSFDRSSMVTDPRRDAAGAFPCAADGGYFPPVFSGVAVTPKLIRKRKAEDETLPFSTTKKQAILSSMPQRSLLLGTPFTPQINKKGARLEVQPTPNIEFTGNDDSVVFSATPKVVPSGSNLLASSSSVRRSMRRKNSLGKSGCFSPKTSKTSVRHSFRGFFRRLSGSKDRQHSVKCRPGDMSGLERSMTSAAAAAMGGDQTPSLADSQNVSTRRMVSSLFARRKKTPSVPAPRPVSSLLPISSPNKLYDPLHLPKLNLDDPTSTEIPAVTSSHVGPSWLNLSLPPTRPHCRRFSEDGTPVGSTSLCRGRPNSTKTGLIPSPIQQRSMLMSVGESVTPLICRRDVAVIDTSPIVAAVTLGTANKESETLERNKERERVELTRCNSKCSLLDDSTHNQAFTESMLISPEVDAASPGENVDGELQVGTSAPENVDGGEERVMDLSGSEKSPPPGTDAGKDGGQGSTTSLDSAIDVGISVAVKVNLIEIPCVTDPVTPVIGAVGSFLRTDSRQSVTSHDSGLGLVDPPPAPICLAADGSIQSPTPDMDIFQDSFRFTREGSCLIGIRNSTRRRSTRADPNLQVSVDLHNLLSKAGVAVEDVPAQNIASVNDGKKLESSEVIAEQQCGVGELREMFERRASPLRFANSTTRTRALSPAPSACSRSLSQKPPIISKRQPIIPISTNLLRVSYDADGVKISRSETLRPGDIERGETKLEALCCATQCTPAGAAPRIKSALLTPSMAQRLGAAPRGAASSMRCRSPGKSVKRLQVSPRNVRSPMRPLSPSRINIAGQKSANGNTVAVPFDLDI